MLIELGNSSALEPQVGTYTDEERPEPVRIEGAQVTVVEVPDSTALDAALTEIKQVWGLHSGASKPDWVEGNNDLLVAAIANVFGCPVGRDTDPIEPEPIEDPQVSPEVAAVLEADPDES